MPRGGARPNSGPKKGSHRLTTISKLEAREFVRQFVTAQLQPLLEAQIANAKGLKYLVVRERKSGKFVRVTEAMARAKQGSNEETIEVWEKDPSVQAFTDLLNRSLDKPADQVQQLDITGALEVHWKAVK